MRKNIELKLIFWAIVALFAAFLAVPLLLLFGKSVWDGGLTTEFYTSVVVKKGFLPALGNSVAIPCVVYVLHGIALAAEKERQEEKGYAV